MVNATHNMTSNMTSRVPRSTARFSPATWLDADFHHIDGDPVALTVPFWAARFFWLYLLFSPCFWVVACTMYGWEKLHGLLSAITAFVFSCCMFINVM